MRILRPIQATALKRLSPLKWQSSEPDAAFIFAVPDNKIGFAGFFLVASKDLLDPSLCIDEGSGFDELKRLSLKPFPFAFYHVPVRDPHKIRRISFCASHAPATFRFVSIWIESAIVIALLHYMFNLRYQKISVLEPDKSGDSFWSSFKRSSQRIIKFFSDVSKGGGVRIQESADDAQKLKLGMSVAAQVVQARMEDAFATRNSEPLISFIVPTYNTDPVYLADLLHSYKIQNANYAELILADDGSTKASTLAKLSETHSEDRVTVLMGATNQGIASALNRGIEASRGTWVSFIDHDDQFVSGAVAVIADAIMQHPEAEFFFTDEVVTNATLHAIGEFCKPAFDSVLLSGMNYINHFSIFRRSRLEEIGRLRMDRDGSQDYDLLLRYLSGLKPKTIVHVPYPAYLWRCSERSFSHVHADASASNARRAIAEAYEARGHHVEVLPALDPTLHRISFKRPQPAVSVIIPNKDSFRLIKRIVDDLQHKTTYPSLEIVIVDNGSHDKQVLDFYDQLRNQTSSVTIDVREEPFNFSKMCNRGAELAKGDVLLMLNNDIEVCEPHWLEEMVECLAYDSAGIVGAKLLYPDGTIQHNGVIVGLGQAAGHWFVGEKGTMPGLMGRFNVRQTLTAVTGACMLITRACFEAAGGFDELTFPIAYNDIDFCLRAREKGFRTIWTPFAQLVHHESATRGSDEAGENKIRFSKDFANLQQRHATADYIDDAYSPFYDWRYSTPRLVVPKDIPKARPNRFS